MKRALIITTILCMLAPAKASAQWYLNVGKKAQQDTTKVVAKTATPVVIEQIESNTEARIDTVRAESGLSRILRGIFRHFKPESEFPETIGVALALPFNLSAEKPNSNFVEMYSGALLAARDLAASGVKLDLRVIDSSEGNISSSDLEDRHVIIGPVAYEHILQAEPLLDGDNVIISPLEPKVADIVDSRTVVQAPVSWNRQIDELILWAKADMMLEGGNLVVVKDNHADGIGAQSKYLLDKLAASGLAYRTVSSVAEAGVTKNEKTRIFLASDRTEFITSSVKAIGISAARGNDIALYTTTKVRNSLGANVADLHAANTRLTAAYYIDYDSEDVRNFILAYRAVYNGEPGSFAFQGYDAMKYFVGMCAKYGTHWYEKLPEHSESGLQSDFNFDWTVGDGRLNTAVRRIIYNNDLSATLLK